MAENRRGFLLAGLGAFAGYTLLRRWTNRPARPQFADHPNVPGFRMLEREDSPALSLGGAQFALIGLEPEDPVPEAMLAEVAADPVQALFGPSPLPGPTMAYFTDIRCPICRPFEASLAQLREENPGLGLVTHEFPVFGESSTLAALALIAAGPELAGRLRPRLQRSSVVMTEAYLARVISDLGGDAERILGNLHSAETSRTLNRSRALAEIFGFFGTPSLVLGRTAMIGAQPLGTLRTVLEMERR